MTANARMPAAARMTAAPATAAPVKANACMPAAARMTQPLQRQPLQRRLPCDSGSLRDGVDEGPVTQ